jgi:hypothetical protein
MGQVNSELDDM